MIKIGKKIKSFPRWVKPNTEKVEVTFSVKNIGVKDFPEKMSLIPILSEDYEIDENSLVQIPELK